MCYLLFILCFKIIGRINLKIEIILYFQFDRYAIYFSFVITILQSKNDENKIDSNSRLVGQSPHY